MVTREVTVTSDLAESVGISYRQLDHWITQGWIRAEGAGQGSGCRRYLSDTEAETLRWAAQMIRFGVAPRHALRACRELLTTGEGRLGMFRVSAAMPRKDAA